VEKKIYPLRLMEKPLPKIAFLILFVLLLFNTLAWIAIYDLNQPRFLEVNFFDIGQGDAIFIETPQRHQILIDGGPGRTILEKLNKEMPFWDRNLDLIILTHPEHDHMAGLIEVLKRYKVDYILWTGVLRDTSEYQKWSEVIENKMTQGTQIKIARAGQKIILQGLNLCNFIDILYPFEDLEGKMVKNTNNTSIVSRLIFGQNSFLFTGDIYQKVEKELVEKEAAQKEFKLLSTVLKIAHHGSKTSSGEEFFERVAPEIAVISAGKDNSYGHPHQEVLEKLNKFGIKILRTDLNGDIKVVSDGLKFKIKTQK